MWRSLAVLLSLAIGGCQTEGPYHRWEKIELSFQGPESQSMGEPNPFLVGFDVIFEAPDGREFQVPGFYDGDGEGGADGSVWRVRFSADQNGPWRYRTVSDEALLRGQGGSFEVVNPSPEAPELYRAGRLQYVGRPYLKFHDGGFWLKAGADEPENILGEAFGDWEEKKKQIDYLARQGINSIYVMTHTLEGDADDVWPWIGATSGEARKNLNRFDGAKLQQWRDFFEYVQRRGIVLYLVLEDDSAWTGFDREAYYREIVARFGDLPAVYFNAGEEANENYSLKESLSHMRMLAGIDPYDHPRAIHNVRMPIDIYVDSPVLHLTSVQTWPTSAQKLNQLAVAWHEACLARGQRRLVVNFDEARPADDRRSAWAVYLGGGLWEPIVPAPEGYAALEPLWKELGAVKGFMESMPFERMSPANHLVQEGQAFCFAKPGEVYAVYLPDGGSVQLLVPEAEYQIEWFDPREGRFAGPLQSVLGPELALKSPTKEDWAARIRPVSEPVSHSPVAASARVHSLGGKPVGIHLALWDQDAPASYDTEIVSAPEHGALTGTGSSRVYSPNPGFTGQDRFQWRARGEGWQSNVATVIVYANAEGKNQRPEVQDQRVRVEAGQTKAISLRYSDPDGPGPHLWQIREEPSHGSVIVGDNDVVYTPDTGFSGEDQFRWAVSDGLDLSRTATVTIRVGGGPGSD